MYHYNIDFGPTEMWSASAEWTPEIREGAFGSEGFAPTVEPTSVKTFVAVGLIAGLVSIALGTLAFGTINVNRTVALAETSVPLQVSGWTNLK